MTNERNSSKVNVFKQIWNNKDLKSKILFTLLVIVIFEIGANIPVPGINREVLNNMFNGEASSGFDLFNLFTGGAFGNMTIFAMGITPYITASIIMQLLTIAIPRIEAMSKEGETGRKRMATITRYLAVFLGFIQALGITFGLFRNAVTGNTLLVNISIICILTAGMAFLMWLGEQVNEHGIGNGISIIIFASIANRIPVDAKNIWLAFTEGTISTMTLILIFLAALAIIAFVIYVNEGVRKIPVNYAKRVVGRKAYGGSATHLPIKVNAAGVIPIIFALSLLQFPLMFTYMFPGSKYSSFITKYLSTQATPGVYIYMIINILLIMFFTYFYTSIVFKPAEVSNNLAQSGGSIPGIRPGRPTTDYIGYVSNRLCLPSGIFLALISTLPVLTSTFSSLNLSFGGTSILIVVGVALDTMKQIENKMILNTSYGFLSGARK